MTKVDGEMAQEFLRLSDLGHSYIDIGNRFGVNHRTVSDWVKRTRGFTQKRHWEEILRGLDTKYMDEHHQLLLATGRGIFGSTAKRWRLSFWNGCVVNARFPPSRRFALRSREMSLRRAPAWREAEPGPNRSASSPW